MIWVQTVCPYTYISQMLLTKIYSERLKADSILRLIFSKHIKGNLYFQINWNVKTVI